MHRYQSVLLSTGWSKLLPKGEYILYMPPVCRNPAFKCAHMHTGTHTHTLCVHMSVCMCMCVCVCVCVCVFQCLPPLPPPHHHHYSKKKKKKLWCSKGHDAHYYKQHSSWVLYALGDIKKPLLHKHYPAIDVKWNCWHSYTGHSPMSFFKMPAPELPMLKRPLLRMFMANWANKVMYNS